MSEKFSYPTQNKHRVTSPFGWRRDPVTKKATKHHNGVDIVTGKRDEPVLAVANGRVLKAQKSTAKSGGFGYYVVIRHYIGGKFYTSLYAHLKEKSFKVKPGDKVSAGQQIGIMGTTGYSTGIHLHLEIWKGRTHGWSADGKGFADPLPFIEGLIAKQNISNPTPATQKVSPVAKHPAPTEPAKKPAVKKPAAKKPVAKPKTTKAKPAAPAIDRSTKRMYTVRAGDSYWKIGKQFKVDYRKLQRLNNNKPLHPGDVIKLD